MYDPSLWLKAWEKASSQQEKQAFPGLITALGGGLGTARAPKGKRI